MKLRIIYPVISVCLILWLLAANVELRYYRSTRLALDVNQITTGLTLAGADLSRALTSFDQNLTPTAIEWLVMAEKDLGNVDVGAIGYNTSLNRRFARSQGSRFDLTPVAAMYAQEIRSVRQPLEYGGQLRPEDRTLLEDVAADLATLQKALPRELLMHADQDTVRPLIRNLGPSLRVQSIRGWLGV